MSNINLIVTNPNDVHRILKDFGTYRIENKKDHLDNDHFERKKRCRDHDLDGYNHVEDDSTDVVYRKKYKTPVNRRSDYLVQDNDHSRKIVSQSQKTITLEEFLEERNRLVMRLDKNSKKRLLETTHPPPFYQPQTTPYSYHPSVQFFPNTGVPTPYNMYGGPSQYSQVGANPTDASASASASASFNDAGHPDKSNTSSRQLELQLPDDSRSPLREVQRSSPSTTQQQHHSRQQQQKKKQQQQQQYQQQQQQQQQQQPYTRSQRQVRTDIQKSTNPDVSSPELFRGLMDEIGDIDEV